jgi:phosphatidylglycerophosphatase C
LNAELATACESPPSDSFTPTAPRRTVLFDFDGVLVRGDAFGHFLRERILASRWRHALALLVAPIALPLLRTHRGVPFATRVFSWISRVGADADVYAQQLHDFAQRLARDPAREIGDGIAALKCAHAAGDRVVVVSGNIESLVREVLANHGLADVEIVASKQEPAPRHCIGHAKLAALARIGVLPPWDIAYSDSLLDLPILRHARRAVLVNARPRLREEVARRLGREPEHVHWR